LVKLFATLPLVQAGVEVSRHDGLREGRPAPDHVQQEALFGAAGDLHQIRAHAVADPGGNLKKFIQNFGENLTILCQRSKVYKK
jgi:hypothetical protein